MSLDKAQQVTHEGEDTGRRATPYRVSGLPFSLQPER